MTLNEAKRIAWSLGYRLERLPGGNYLITPSQYKAKSDIAYLLGRYADTINEALELIQSEGR